MQTRFLLPVLVASAATLLAACGGGGAGSDDGPGGRAGQLTDPAAVPSTAAISGEMTFLIRDNGVQAPGGASTAVAGASTPVTANRGVYEIKEGDICSTIAEELGVTVDALLDANRGTDCSSLMPGSQLRIPGGGATPTPSVRPSTGQSTPTPSGGSGQAQYEIQADDLCVDIAASYGITVDALVAANDIDCDNLRVGQVITIP